MILIWSFVSPNIKTTCNNKYSNSSNFTCISLIIQHRIISNFFFIKSSINRQSIKIFLNPPYSKSFSIRVVYIFKRLKSFSVDIVTFVTLLTYAPKFLNSNFLVNTFKLAPFHYFLNFLKIALYQLMIENFELSL